MEQREIHNADCSVFPARASESGSGVRIRSNLSVGQESFGKLVVLALVTVPALNRGERPQRIVVMYFPAGKFRYLRLVAWMVAKN